MGSWWGGQGERRYGCGGLVERPVICGVIGRLKRLHRRESAWAISHRDGFESGERAEGLVGGDGAGGWLGG